MPPANWIVWRYEEWEGWWPVYVYADDAAGAADPFAGDDVIVTPIGTARRAYPTREGDPERQVQRLHGEDDAPLPPMPTWKAAGGLIGSAMIATGSFSIESVPFPIPREAPEGE